MPEKIRICDVSPRDGLQNEKNDHITTTDKLRLIDGLVTAGIDYLEVTAFVNPKAVPMMADAIPIMETMREKYPDIHTTALVFNERGYQNAVDAGANAIAIVLIVPDSLSKSNTGKTATDWVDRYSDMVRQAKSDGIWVRTYLAGAWVCPFEGQVDPQQVLHYGDIFWDLGVDELCPTDPIGHAHPAQVQSLMALMVDRYDASKLAIHLHDTLGFGIANTYAALSTGVRVFDTSVGGLGGCPFAPGAAGNLATEDLVLLADKMGYQTGVDLDSLYQVVNDIEPIIGRPIGGRSRKWYDSERVTS